LEAWGGSPALTAPPDLLSVSVIFFPRIRLTLEGALIMQLWRGGQQVHEAQTVWSP